MKTIEEMENELVIERLDYLLNFFEASLISSDGNFLLRKGDVEEKFETQEDVYEVLHYIYDKISETEEELDSDKEKRNYLIGVMNRYNLTPKKPENQVENDYHRQRYKEKVSVLDRYISNATLLILELKNLRNIKEVIKHIEFENG